MHESVKNTLNAKVYEAAIHSPLDYAQKLSALLKNDVYFKREDLQPVKSFKIRGAYNKISQLSESEKSRGVIAASAGNHAQGVAFSAKKLGIKSIIVMPTTTPKIKVDAVESYGAQVELCGDNYSEAAEYCKARVKETGMTYIAPFDDELVIAGQGTIGREILDDLPEVDAVFLPVGGGGLIAGVAQYVKRLRPEVKIIGVEPVDSNAMQRSLKQNKRVHMSDVGIFADGVAVKQVGEKNLAIAQEHVDEIITVTTDQQCAAIKYIYEENRTIVEPAGALGVAGLVSYALEQNLENNHLVAINSGANMNFERLQFIAERTLLGSGNEAIYAITLPEKPGALEKMCNEIVGDLSISEFNYRLHDRDSADIFVGVGLHTPDEKTAFEQRLQKGGYSFEDYSDNDLAKLHIRHMIGGRGSQAPSERLYSFVFPEKPGALSSFLAMMSKRWNISVFHYRGLGGDVGRVLLGFEVAPAMVAEFDEFLAEQDYPYTDETANPAYERFLRPSNRG